MDKVKEVHDGWYLFYYDKLEDRVELMAFVCCYNINAAIAELEDDYSFYDCTFVQSVGVGDMFGRAGGSHLRKF